MKQTIKIAEKNVYGRILLYPVCDTAKKFATLLNVKTFTLSQIVDIKALGYEVDCLEIPR
jgi:hypothetical protein